MEWFNHSILLFCWSDRSGTQSVQANKILNEFAVSIHQFAADLFAGQGRQGGWHLRWNADGHLHGFTEFSRMGGGQADDRNPLLLVDEGSMHSNGSVRIEDITVFFVEGLNGRQNFRFRGGGGDKVALDLIAGACEVKPARIRKLVHCLFGARWIFIEKVVKVPFEVGGCLDVHGGTGGGDHRAQRVIPVCNKAGKDVVGIACQKQLANGAFGEHSLGDVSGEDVAKIAGGDGKIHGLVMLVPMDVQTAVDVIDHLGQDSRPVDGVDRPQAVLFFEVDIVEDGLDNGLPVVKSAADGDIKYIGVGDRGHLQLLDGADSFVGMKDEDVDLLLAPYSIDSSAARISRGGPDDVHDRVIFLEQIFKEISQKLQGNILEGKGRPMKELEDMEVPVVNEWGDVRVLKCGVRAIDQLVQVTVRDVINEA